VTKRGLPAARAELGVVTTRQTPAVARPANASAARAGVAEAGRDLGVSVEKDEEEVWRRTTASLRSETFDAGAVTSQFARILTALGSAASEQSSCRAWLLLLVRRSDLPGCEEGACFVRVKQERCRLREAG
jgi:hypothetical protein